MALVGGLAGLALAAGWPQASQASAPTPITIEATPRASLSPTPEPLAATNTPQPPAPATLSPTLPSSPSATPASPLAPSPSAPPDQKSSAPAVLIIGKSVAGRPLEVFVFGAGQRARMIVAGIHGGNEWNTIALADELIAHLQTHPELVPDDLTLYVLRALNPDGEARAHGVDGRVNHNGVDLNRNFPANWLRNWSRSGCWQYRETSGGPYPGSEPETQALIWFLRSHPVEALISYHSAALGVFPGGEPPDPASSDLAEAIAEASGYPYPPLETGCIYSGTLPDWAVSQGIPAVDVELTDHFHTDFEINLAVLKVFLAWQYNQ